MAISTELEPTTIELSESFAALADPVRIRIIETLAEGGRCVCALRAEVGVAPNLLSYHLRVLRRSGLIVGTRRGRWIDYRLDQDGINRLREALPVLSPDIIGAKECP